MRNWSVECTTASASLASAGEPSPHSNEDRRHAVPAITERVVSAVADHHRVGDVDAALAQASQRLAHDVGLGAELLVVARARDLGEVPGEAGVVEHLAGHRLGLGGREGDGDARGVQALEDAGDAGEDGGAQHVVGVVVAVDVERLPGLGVVEAGREAQAVESGGPT